MCYFVAVPAEQHNAGANHALQLHRYTGSSCRHIVGAAPVRIPLVAAHNQYWAKCSHFAGRCTTPIYLGASQHHHSHVNPKSRGKDI